MSDKLLNANLTALPRLAYSRAGYARQAFEQWVSNMPYEREIERWPDSDGENWRCQYKDIAVQLAWEAWQQAQNAERTDRPKGN